MVEMRSWCDLGTWCTTSPSARRVLVEIVAPCPHSQRIRRSPSARRVLVEIAHTGGKGSYPVVSPSARRALVEIPYLTTNPYMLEVTLLEEGVG